MDQPQTPPFVPSAEYLARVKRFDDAVALRKPDRVPVASLSAFFVTRYAVGPAASCPTPSLPSSTGRG
jgi:hypothetical protein